jgi:hypothetical protein
MKTSILRVLGLVTLSLVTTVLVVAETKPAAKVKAPAKAHALAQAETVNGTIASVDLAKRLIVVKDSAGTPFDFVVTPATRIESSHNRLKMQDLTSRTNTPASVKFVPMRKGDLAKSISITG